MPHDAKGQLVQVGDTVAVRCKVTAISAGEDYCNLSLETVEPMHPGTYKSTLSLNAKQVEVVREEAQVDQAADGVQSS